MKIVKIEKIGEDYGGDNLLFTLLIEEDSHIRTLKGLGGNLDEILWNINHEYEFEFQWGYEVDEWNENKYYFSTTYIDKDDLYHTIKDNTIITEKFIDEMIIDDCLDVMEDLQRIYQAVLWERIRLNTNYEDDIYEQYLDTDCVDDNELNNLEKLMMKEITLKEFAEKQGYEW